MDPNFKFKTLMATMLCYHHAALEAISLALQTIVQDILKISMEGSRPTLNEDIQTMRATEQREIIILMRLIHKDS